MARLLTSDDLQPGDILLFANRSRWSPKALCLRVFCRSYYTHAAIYLGDSVVAEATLCNGVAKARISIPRRGHVAVIRTQAGSCCGLGFDDEMTNALHRYVDKVIAAGAGYNLAVAALCNAFGAHSRRRQKHFEDVIQLLNRPIEESDKELRWLSRLWYPKTQAYWCSEFVGNCYFNVGILHGSMTGAQPPKLLLPADIVNAVDFGWVAGFLAHAGNHIPDDDICLQGTKHWEVCATSPARCPRCPY